MISLLVIATRRYNEYVAPLLSTVERYFFPGITEVHLWSDCRHDGVVLHPIDSLGFPEATLRRYELFNQHWDKIQGDHVFYSDVDMLWRLPCEDDKVLGRLVGVKHKHYVGGGGTFEDRQPSMAYVPPELRQTYYAGGFNGGTREAFEEMSRTLAENIRKDTANGIEAVWHDESHLNAYFAGRSDVTALEPVYCWPEEIPNDAARLICCFKPPGHYR